MSDLTLTEKDFEMLLEAIDAWASAPFADSIPESLMAGVLGPGDRSAREAGVRAIMSKGAEASKFRRGVAIILKAKVELARQAAQSAAIEAAKGKEPS